MPCVAERQVNTISEQAGDSAPPQFPVGASYATFPSISLIAGIAFVATSANLSTK